MKNRSKYELASPEVQEVITKPPHLLVIWGNTFILLIIALCLVLLNTITIPRYVWLEYNVAAYDSLKIRVTIHKDLSEGELQSKIFQLPVIGDKVQFQSFRIDSILKKDPDQSIISATAVHEGRGGSSPIKNDGEGRILMDQLTIFERILQQFKR